MATPRIEDIVRVTCTNRGIDVTEEQIQRISRKARTPPRGWDTLKVLEVEIAALDRALLDALIRQREAELADLKKRRRAVACV